MTPPQVFQQEPQSQTLGTDTEIDSRYQKYDTKITT